MNRFTFAFAVCLIVPCSLFAQNQAVPQIPFDSVPNFLKLPANLYLGEAAGVAVNSKGHVFVFSPRQQHGSSLWCERHATAGVRPRRHLHPRDWAQPVRLVLRARREGG